MNSKHFKLDLLVYILFVFGFKMDLIFCHGLYIHPYWLELPDSDPHLSDG